MPKVKTHCYEITLVKNGEFKRFEEHFEKNHRLEDVRASVIARFVTGHEGWALVSCIPMPQKAVA